jgi:NMD protein affecting ribosome stability and mRNA decay
MKREIICRSCSRKPSAMQLNPEQFSDEWIMMKTGKARHLLLCDHCGEKIKQGDPCTAISIVAVKGNPYYPWEDSYMRITNGG